MTLMGGVVVGVLLIAKGLEVVGAVINDVDIRAGGVASGHMGGTCVTVHGCRVSGVGKACCIGCSLSVSTWKQLASRYIVPFLFFLVLVPFPFHALFLPLPAV